MLCGHLEIEWDARKMRPQIPDNDKKSSTMEIVVFRSSDIQTRSVVVFFFSSRISALGDKKKRGCEGLDGFLGKILIKVPIFQG
jgi:hypothetical protein